MGCGTSKLKKQCRHCKNPLSPVSRSYTVHVHHPPQTKGDSYHVVALTSSSLGSLDILDTSILDSPLLDNNKVLEKIDLDDLKLYSDKENVIEDRRNEIDLDDRWVHIVGLSEVKTCSGKIEEKIPRIIPQTPITTPPGEPETIDAWELMAGLEESPFLTPARFRRSSLDVSPIHDDHDPNDQVKHRSPVQETEAPATKSMWLQIAEDESFSTEFDPEIISEFRKAIAELSPDNNYNKPFDSERQHMDGKEDRLFEVHNDKKVNGDNVDLKCQNPDKAVLYFTSLRGVRKTYEDCCYVRVILKGLGVRVDERDVSMDSGFKEELRELLGDRFDMRPLLPKLFLGSKCIGGAEEIRRMHEDGNLEKLLDGCGKVRDSLGGSGPGVCEACGDIRFIPCETCSGSCKVFYECKEYGAEDEYEEDEFGFQRCPDCNENGLVRCPICCLTF